MVLIFLWFWCVVLSHIIQSYIKITKGLVKNLISDLKGIKENSLPSLSCTNWWLDTLRRIEKIMWKRLLNRGKKKPFLKFKPGSALSRLKTSNNQVQLFAKSNILWSFKWPSVAQTWRWQNLINKSHQNVIGIVL